MFKVDRDICIACEQCIKDCPVNDIYLKEGKAHIKNEACIKCGHCIAICPVKAVSTDDYDMSEVIEYKKEDFQIEPERLLNFIKFRRSVRRFKNKEVEKEKIEKIIEAGRFAPTSTNSQDVSYTVLQKELPKIKALTYEILNKKDIYLKVLKIKGRSMIYVYQKEKLNKLCACKQIQNIFKKYNYNCTSLDTLILDLQKRLNDYDFPHEIGLFLGYPMTDVLGFIEGKESLSVGYWKVYSHVKNCQHTFDKYHKCTHELCKRFNQGENVEQICRYV